MRLQAAGFRALHLLADAADLGDAELVAGQRPVFEQRQQAFPVRRAVHALEEPGLDLGPLAVADGVHQQVAHPGPLEEASEHVVDPSAQGGAGGLQLLEQPAVDLPLARVLRDEAPQVADLGLADAVDAPEALLQAVRVPGQVVVDHQVGALEVDAFAGRIVRDHHRDLRVVHERLHHLAPVRAPDPAVDHDHRLVPAEAGPDPAREVFEGVARLGEDDELSPPPVGAGHERVIEEARELEPLRIRAVAPQRPRTVFEAPQRVDLGLELGDGLRRRGVAEHTGFDRIYVFLGRLFEIVGIEIGVSGGEGAGGGGDEGGGGAGAGGRRGVSVVVGRRPKRPGTIRFPPGSNRIPPDAGRVVLRADCSAPGAARARFGARCILPGAAWGLDDAAGVLAAPGEPVDEPGLQPLAPPPQALVDRGGRGGEPALEDLEGEADVPPPLLVARREAFRPVHLLAHVVGDLGV